MCFAAALRNRGFASTLIHSYDRFRLGPFERERWFAVRERPPGDITRPLYDANLRGFDDLICVHEGDILAEGWPGHAIEILFVDIAKNARVWDHLVTTFFPSLLPSRSLLILQDYLYGETGPWHHVVMEKLSGHFSIISDTGINSVLFQYHGGLSPEIIEAAAWTASSPTIRSNSWKRPSVAWIPTKSAHCSPARARCSEKSSLQRSPVAETGRASRRRRRSPRRPSKIGLANARSAPIPTLLSSARC
jgi:hypothetical protein